MECKDVRELADSFLSEQLLVETNHAIVRHLETCPGCRAELDSRRALRERLRGALARADSLQPGAEFASALTAKLRASAVQVPLTAPVTRRTFLQTWWAAAAGLVVALGGGWAFYGTRERARLSALVMQAAGDHQNCAVAFRLPERPVPMVEAGRRYGKPYAALATFDLSPITGTVSIIDRHACVYDGRRFGHVVFTHNGALTSLLVTDGAGAGDARLLSTASGQSIAIFGAGPFVGFVVSDGDPARVLTIATQVSGPLSQHLV